MDERKKNFYSPSKIEIKRCYPIRDNPEASYLEKEGLPGEYPFTRGIQGTMYRGRVWTMRQYAGFGIPSDTNRRFKELIIHGQTGLSIAFDLPTQMGIDSDSPKALGEVGKIGVAVDTLADMEAIFEGISADEVSVSMTANAQAAVMLAMYISVARKRGISLKKLRGTVQNDIIKEYVSRGTYIFNPQDSMRLVCDVIEYCALNLPNWNPISISGYHFREAGCSAIQEIGFMFSSAIAYIEGVLKRGLAIDFFAPKISWIMAAGMNIFEETAKFRAARRIWAKIIKNRFKAQNLSSMKFRVFAATMGSTFTFNEPLNNVVRGAIEAFSAVIGGVQSLHISSYDEAIGIPCEKSALLSLRTQQVLAYESGLCDTADVFAGSSFVEKLTDDIVEGAMNIIDDIEKKGSALKALEKNYFQELINKEAWEEKLMIDRGEKQVVGLNCFDSGQQNTIKPFRISESAEYDQIKKLRKIKEERDEAKVNKTIELLSKHAGTENNLIPFIIDCVEAYATVGEICSGMKKVFCDYNPVPLF